MITVVDPLNLDLTREFLQANRLPVLVAGDDWAMRFRVAENGVGLSLTGARIKATWRKDPFGTVLWTRDSNVVSPFPQLGPDANQTTEELDGDGQPVAGKGWFTMRFGDEDLATLLAGIALLVPTTARSALPFWDVRIRFPGMVDQTYAQGRQEVFRPMTESMA